MDWRSLVLFAAVAVLGIASWFFGEWRRKKKLEAIRALLEGGRLEEYGTIAGMLDGRNVTVRYTARGHSAKEEWTEVRVDHKTLQLDLVVRPQGIFATAIGTASGGVDVNVGDDRFDSAFILEGAPADAIRAVLGASLRARLLELRPIELTTRLGSVMVARKKWLMAKDVVPMLDVAREVAAAVDRLPDGAPGGAYRETGRRVDASAELAALDDARARTERLRKRLVLGALGVFVIVLLLNAFWPRK